MDLSLIPNLTHYSNILSTSSTPCSSSSSMANVCCSYQPYHQPVNTYGIEDSFCTPIMPTTVFNQLQSDSNIGSSTHSSASPPLTTKSPSISSPPSVSPSMYPYSHMHQFHQHLNHLQNSQVSAAVFPYDDENYHHYHHHRYLYESSMAFHHSHLNSNDLETPVSSMMDSFGYFDNQKFITPMAKWPTHPSGTSIPFDENEYHSSKKYHRITEWNIEANNHENKTTPNKDPESIHHYWNLESGKEFYSSGPYEKSAESLKLKIKTESNDNPCEVTANVGQSNIVNNLQMNANHYEN